VSGITFKMANVFHDDKKTYMNDLVQVVAVGAAEECRSLLTGYSQRLQAYGRILRRQDLSPAEKAELLEIVLAGADPETTGLSAFTRDDLVRICEERFGKRLHVTSMGRILRDLGLSRQKTRPSHPQKDPAAQAAFKKADYPASYGRTTTE
jgi:transposase